MAIVNSEKVLCVHAANSHFLEGHFLCISVYVEQILGNSEVCISMFYTKNRETYVHY
jgi:hypothetical protein